LQGDGSTVPPAGANAPDWQAIAGPPSAREVILERSRVRVIAEAFRPQPGGGCRPATLEELRPQLAAYAGFPIYLFEGPLHVSAQLVDELAAAPKAHR